MSEDIHYKGKLLGSVHYNVYEKRQLSGDQDDFYLRLKDVESLEKILTCPDRSILLVKGNFVGERRITAARFRKEILSQTRDIHLEYVVGKKA